MSGELGSNFRVFISSDGTNGGEKKELECQGDLNIETGVSVQTNRYKNCTHSSLSKSGLSVSTSFAEEVPAPTAQDLVWQAHNEEKPWFCWFESKTTGGNSFSGMFKVAISSISAPIEGDVVHNISFGADGDVVHSKVA